MFWLIYFSWVFNCVDNLQAKEVMGILKKHVKPACAIQVQRLCVEFFAFFASLLLVLRNSASSEAMPSIGLQQYFRISENSKQSYRSYCNIRGPHTYPRCFRKIAMFHFVSINLAQRPFVDFLRAGTLRQRSADPVWFGTLAWSRVWSRGGKPYPLIWSETRHQQPIGQRLRHPLQDLWTHWAAKKELKLDICFIWRVASNRSHEEWRNLMNLVIMRPYLAGSTNVGGSQLSLCMYRCVCVCECMIVMRYHILDVILTLYLLILLSTSCTLSFA